ncbi:MAG: histidine kinase [Eubacterium sp.]|nr:histidine kinase [Eubacterium sp.]
MELADRIKGFWRRQRWVMPLMFAVSLLFAILSIVGIAVWGVPDLDSMISFTTGVDVVSLCICTVLLFWLIQDREGFSEYTRTFVLLLFFSSVMLFSDYCLNHLLAGGIPTAVFIAADTCDLAGTFIQQFLLWNFVSTILGLNERFRRFVSILMNVLLAFSLASVLLNLWVPVYFIYDETGWMGSAVLYLWPTIYYGIALFFILISVVLTKNKLKDRLIVATAAVIPIICDMILLPFFDINIGFASTMISLLLLYGMVVAKNERLRMETEKELYEARVNLMVSQMRPHFVYNTLSSIAILCKLEPDTAYEATVAFSDYLRGNMDALKQSGPVPFSKELEHLKKYVYIEQMRFQDKLNVVFDIQATDFFIPILSIQPLVENAIKHGVGMKEDGGTVTIATRESDESFEVIVTDDGVGFDPNEIKKDDGRSHVGRENTMKRLQDMCDAKITYDSTPGEGTEVRIILPKSAQE